MKKLGSILFLSCAFLLSLPTYSAPPPGSRQVVQNAEQRVNEAIANLRQAMDKGVRHFGDRRRLRQAFYQVVDLYAVIAGHPGIPDDEEELLFEKLNTEVAVEAKRLMADYSQIEPEDLAAIQAVPPGIKNWPMKIAVGTPIFLKTIFKKEVASMIIPAQRDRRSGVVHGDFPAGWPLVGEYAELNSVVKRVFAYGRLPYRFSLRMHLRDPKARDQLKKGMRGFADAFIDKNEIALEKIHDIFWWGLFGVTALFTLNAPAVGERIASDPILFGGLYYFIGRIFFKLHERASGLANMRGYNDFRFTANVDRSRIGFDILAMPRRLRHFAWDESKMLCYSALRAMPFTRSMVRDRYSPAVLDQPLPAP